MEANNVYIKAKDDYKSFKILPDKQYKNPKRTSKYKYIFYCKTYNKWLSRYKKSDGKLYFIGYFNTEEEAYKKQQEKIKEISKLEHE